LRVAEFLAGGAMAKKKAKADEAETEGAEGAETGAGTGGRKKKLVLIGGALAVLLAGGGGWWLFLKPKPELIAAQAAVQKPSSFVDLPEMTINLSTQQQERQQFLKLKIALEVADAKIGEEIKPVMPRVLDTFQVYLREMRASDLDGSAAMYRLKEELMRRVNVAIYPAKIEAVLFKEVLVQ
jgi:flagellar FliL protein